MAGPEAADPWRMAPGTSLVRALRGWAATRGEHVALRFLDRGERVSDTATYAELDRAARIAGARLRAAGAAGRPVLIALPQGLDFVRCLLGCLYAGAIPIPSPAWTDPRGTARIAAILAQAQPALVVAERRDGATPANLVQPAELLHGTPDETAHDLRNDPAPDDIALLQYTSGSTSRPRGVVITHGNLAANLEMIRQAFAPTQDETAVSWLPLHHDMGLIGGVLEMLSHGGSVVLMSPLAFLQRPARWLQAIAEYGAASGAVSGGPNFAYDLCARMVTDTQLRGVDLSRWRLAFCGAEPVRPHTLARFTTRFAAAGFAARAFYPCYGLAEATLFVTGGQPGTGATVVERDGAGSSVSCGIPRLDCEVALLHADRPVRVAEAAVGEIAIAGPQVSPGFWDATHGIRPDPARTATLAGRRFLRTGDLGQFIAGELHVVGRVRNMIVLHGANLHAEDVEHTATERADAGTLGAIAALPVTNGAEEGLVVVCELARGSDAPATATTLPQVATAIADAHGVAPLEIVLVPSGAIARTLSGKLQREQTRAAYQSGTLLVLARHVPNRPRPAG